MIAHSPKVHVRFQSTIGQLMKPVADGCLLYTSLLYFNEIMNLIRNDLHFRSSSYFDIPLALLRFHRNTSQLTIDELYAERGRELAWEGWRHEDMIRCLLYTSHYVVMAPAVSVTIINGDGSRLSA